VYPSFFYDVPCYSMRKHFKSIAPTKFHIFVGWCIGTNLGEKRVYYTAGLFK
jgi:hypothetical protein